jgi:regulatory protein
MSDSSGDPYRKALNSALRILARRDHSSVELAQKLMRRGHAEDVVQQVISECLRLDGMKRKGVGTQRIRHELLKRGLAVDGGECGPVESLPPEEERSMARRVALKKWKILQQEPEPGRRRLRLMRFLRSRGFSYAVIYDVMETLEGTACEDPPLNS